MRIDLKDREPLAAALDYGDVPADRNLSDAYYDAVMPDHVKAAITSRAKRTKLEDL